MNNAILYKYLSGLATESEERELLVWLNHSPDNRKEFFELKAIWVAQRVMDGKKMEEDIDKSLEKLNHRINISQRQVHPQKRKHLYRTMGTVAALFLVVVYITYFVVGGTINFPYVENELAVVYTNKEDVHSVRTVLLPDSSVVWLSYNATLTCPDKFRGDQRIVSLTGEAFFEVKKNTDHPFIVKTGAYEIKVLGTSFSVNTHAAEGKEETILMNGSVQIQEPDGRSLAMLRPGQQALYSKNSEKIEIRSVDANALTSWRFGLVSLTEVSIQDILHCLEETYDVKIKMNSSPINDHSYNFSFKRSKGIQPALNQLCFITGISAEILP